MHALSECKEQTLGSLNFLSSLNVLIPPAKAQLHKTLCILRHKWEKEKHRVGSPLYYLYGFKIMHPVQCTL